MTDDLVTRLREHSRAWGHGITSETADEIERLREERDYLRYELNNETDRYMAMKETNSVHIAEIQRLRALIAEWVEAYLDNTRQDAEHASAIDRYCDAVDALLKEAGR
jgi:hypothetical protein